MLTVLFVGADAGQVALAEALFQKWVVPAIENKRALQGAWAHPCTVHSGCAVTNMNGVPGFANEHALACMRGLGLPVYENTIQAISTLNINDYGLIVCMNLEAAIIVLANKPSWLMMVANAAQGGIPVPTEQSVAAYEQCAKVLGKVIAEVIHIIV